MAGRTTLFVLAFASLALVLDGCSGGGGEGGGGGPPSGTLTITARVITEFGVPVGNVQVWFSGNGPFITDSGGQVVASGMPSPYDAVIVVGATASGHVWRGLTRADPTFSIEPINLGLITADVAGTITGGTGFPEPGTHETTVRVGFAQGVGGSSNEADPTTGDYTLAPGWDGPIPATSRVVAMQFLKDMNGDPLGYTGFASLALPPLNPGDDLMNVDLALAPVPTSHVTGLITVPPGLVVFQKVAVLEGPGAEVVGIPTSSPLGPALDLYVPLAAGFERHLIVLATNIAFSAQVFLVRFGLPDPAPNVAIDVPAPTGNVSPPFGTTGVGHGTTFQITPSAGGRTFRIAFEPQGTGPRITLHTVATSFSIPDLSDFGLPIPAGATYRWEVRSQSPLASLDEAASPPAIIVIAPIVSNGTGDPFATFADGWDFTFAP